MTHLTTQEIQEAQSWGGSLIASGLLVILLALMFTNEWFDAVLMIWVGAAMSWGGWWLYPSSDQAGPEVSNTQR
jgi:hypothetical protein